MGFDKLHAPLAGRAVVWHALSQISLCASVRRIVLVCPVGGLSRFEDYVVEFPKIAAVVEGGAERADSVNCGVEVLMRLPGRPADFVAVHDAARPLVTPGAVTACFRAAVRHGAAALAERVTDTLHRSDGSGRAVASVSRENLWRMQTPQILRREVLLALPAGGFSDEVSALLHQKIEAVLVENPAPNFKITVRSDLALAEALLRAP